METLVCPNHPYMTLGQDDFVGDTFCPACEAELEAGEPFTGETCQDCGLAGERTGHMTCQYPQDRN